MNEILIVNNGEFEFTNFNDAVRTLEMEYGYEGFMWEMVVASGDFEILSDFLSDDGLMSEVEEV